MSIFVGVQGCPGPMVHQGESGGGGGVEGEQGNNSDLQSRWYGLTCQVGGG